MYAIRSYYGIHVATLYEWQSKYSEFADVLKIATFSADEKIENALYKNGIGYWYKEEVALKIKTEYYRKGQKYVKEKIEIVTLNKWHQAETTAVITSYSIHYTKLYDISIKLDSNSIFSFSSIIGRVARVASPSPLSPTPGPMT